MNKLLKALSSTLRCPKCTSLNVNYEANDNLQLITFNCADCGWKLSTNYKEARESGFEPTGGYYDTTVTVLNEDGEVTTEFKTKF